MELVRPLSELSSADLDLAGGKGANLGELVRAGFHVPDGWVLTTAAYDVAARAAAVDPTRPDDAAARLRSAPVPDAVTSAALGAYAALGRGPVAVRSSATAEDLPGASFAGQQDTYLNVSGDGPLLDAIRSCWASLWNERAVAYRRANGIEDARVSLAVVVQRMVDADAAGVLFTADPITGRRARAVIDAVRGLGEALVSGRVDPEHYAVDTVRGAVLERRGSILDDARLREIASVGDRIERHYGAPQDIEWAIDRGADLWIVQSRAITTLYPLPPDAPDPSSDLRVYFSANVAQGVFEPFTAMGVQTFRLISSAFATVFGAPPADPVAGVRALTVAGMRIFLDITGLLRDPIGARLFPAVLSVMEARSAPLVAPLLADPRLRPTGSEGATLRRLLPAVARTGALFVLIRGLIDPDRTRVRVLGEVDAILGEPDPPAMTAEQRLDAFERLILERTPRMFPRLVGLVGSGVLPFVAARRVLGPRARPDELQTLLRGLPHNPTTEMDLELWSVAREARLDRTRLEPALAHFLDRYGHRAVGEIDLGVPRWGEDPSHLRAAVEGYMKLGREADAPDVQFARGAREADAMAATLVGRVHGPRRMLLRRLLRRVRANAGLREQPKNQIIRLFAKGRALLAPVGLELVRRGAVERADDIWHLDLREARRALAGTDMRELVARRRAERARELARRYIPRLLLSDGTDVEAAFAPAREGGLRGAPASPGTVTGVARVVRSPVGAHLEPGEILVAPSTDPGWTPLFLTAGGLVMEMGGMMSHGAVVAREYGIPAVVGVAGATERITTGQRVTVDGSTGVVGIEAD